MITHSLASVFYFSFSTSDNTLFNSSVAFERVAVSNGSDFGQALFLLQNL
jgi:hypothetical protein